MREEETALITGLYRMNAEADNNWALEDWREEMRREQMVAAAFSAAKSLGWVPTLFVNDRWILVVVVQLVVF